MADGLSNVYHDLLDGSYDCVDRIVLNGYDNPLDALGGRRFARRIRGYAKAHQIPVIDCGAGERKHNIAEEHLKTTKVKRGLFLVLVGRAQARVWDVGKNYHIEAKKPMPYVNHYSFHILDPDWGHITIKSVAILRFPRR